MSPCGASSETQHVLKLSGPALHEKHVRGLLANVDDAEDVRVRDAPDMLHRRERVAATHGALEEDFRCESASAKPVLRLPHLAVGAAANAPFKLVPAVLHVQP